MHMSVDSEFPPHHLNQNALERGIKEHIFTHLVPVVDRKAGQLDDVFISVKDNIDVAGLVTTAGAQAFAGNAPAIADAPLVKSLKDHGATVIAKSNMTEFAYSATGINKAFGTPRNPWSSDGEHRIPGGSSSGAAVAIALGLGNAAIGTDTAGSARIPAALCGVVGFQPRQSRICLDGVIPLSTTYDCVGVLANTVAMVARVFNCIAAPSSIKYSSMPKSGGPIRVLWPTNHVNGPSDVHDSAVSITFDAAVAKLSSMGVEIHRRDLSILPRALEMLSEGGLTAPEAVKFHQPHFERLKHQYDQYTLDRLENGQRCTEARYQALLAKRALLISEAVELFQGFDAVIYPTCPIIAPRLSEIRTSADQEHFDTLLLWNTAVSNVLNLPAISIPCNNSGQAPVGLSLMTTGSEEVLLDLASVVDHLLHSRDY
ncbi:amidase family protein [Pseudomonas sp. TE21394]